MITMKFLESRAKEIYNVIPQVGYLFVHLLKTCNFTKQVIYIGYIYLVFYSRLDLQWLLVEFNTNEYRDSPALTRQ